jgi:hypothetical protein
MTGLNPRDGTGNTPTEAEIDALEYVVEEGRTASIDDYGILRSWLVRLRPEWESQSYEESDEKRMNANTNRDATPSEGSVQSRCALTDEEREAIEWFAEVRKPLTRLTQSHNREKYKDTLCGLLERLK